MSSSAGDYGAGEVIGHSADPMHLGIFGKIHYPRRLKGKGKFGFYTNPESRVRPHTAVLTAPTVRQVTSACRGVPANHANQRE
jgi:hypothetical protein